MDIIFSILMIIFSIYLFFLVGSQSPASTPTELGAAFWPRIILVLLILLFIVNVVNNIKASKKDGAGLLEGMDIMGFLKSKLLVGILIVAVMALAMPYIGFIPDCFLFLIAYGFLLGERKIPILVIRSLILTIVIYVIFQGALDIMLARGNGMFREFALMLEGILPF